ncbi:hypothetical protein [Mesoplasma melaleucae]|uniref:hypothetical protein n=1 Tax=Mesoplasma melaleucae TaxID=81459 RepID=UPI000482F7DD|nr:hypothetical protein [Mesoplasma melaleucae]
MFKDYQEHLLKSMFEATCNDDAFFESIKSIDNKYNNYLIYPGHWADGFKLEGIISNKNHPYNKLK